MKRWGSLIGTLIVLALLVYVLWGINFYEIYLLIAQANLIWFALAILCSFLTFIIWNFRWKYIFRKLFKGDFWYLLHVLLAGAFFNTVTPGAGIGGEPFRAHFLAKKYKKPHTKILGYILGDKIFQLAILGFFTLFSIFFVLIYVKISSNLKLILELLLIFVVVSFVVILFLTLRKVKFNLGLMFKRLHWFKFINSRFVTSEDFVKYIDKRINMFSGVFRKVVKDKKNIFVGISFSVVFWMLNFFVAYFLFLSFGYDVNFLNVVIVITLSNLIGAVSIIPGGVGVIEGSITLLFSAMGIPSALALLVAFMNRIIYYFFALFIGGMSLVHLRRKQNGSKFGLF